MPCSWQCCKDEISSLLPTIDSIKKKEKELSSININIPNLKLDVLEVSRAHFSQWIEDAKPFPRGTLPGAGLVWAFTVQQWPGP